MLGEARRAEDVAPHHRSENSRARFGMSENIEFVGLDHVQVAAPRGSEDKRREFFGSILGLKEIQKPATSRGA